MSGQLLGEVWRGVVLGLAVVLPGISGGTAALVMGIYEELVRDFSHFRWRPHLALAAGAAAGLLLGARAIGWVMEAVPERLAAFLLGVVLASAWLVLRRFSRPGLAGLVALAAGCALALALAGEPLGARNGRVAAAGEVFLGGTVSAAAMMLPGMSGGTLLIMLGLYDDMVTALNRLELARLAVFSAGAVIGMFGVARLVSRLLELAPVLVGLFLGGMILGSTRAVLPATWDAGAVALAAAGAAAVYAAAGREESHAAGAGGGGRDAA